MGGGILGGGTVGLEDGVTLGEGDDKGVVVEGGDARFFGGGVAAVGGLEGSGVVGRLEGAAGVVEGGGVTVGKLEGDAAGV